MCPHDPRHERRPPYQEGQSAQPRGKEQGSKNVLLTGRAAGVGALAIAQKWGPWSALPPRGTKAQATVNQQDSLPTGLPAPSKAVSGLKTTMQRGTPLYSERHY